MPELKIHVEVRVPELNELRRRLSGEEWEKMKRDIGLDMARQVAINLIKHGGPSGDWAKLSGFGANVGRKQRIKDIRSEKSALTSDFSEEEQGYIRQGARWRKLDGRQRNWQENHSRHLGYAREKEQGRTPGAGKFSEQVRLRDTDELHHSLEGRVNGDKVQLVAVGKSGDRPSNEELLEWHATGAGNLPKRNPADPADMQNFEARVAKRLEDVMAKPAPTAKPPASSQP
jgi:hypothetical protein